ncbi:HEPN-associated N-terminal domain-containing protein [Candidatus Palauibacter sp.]|uniref:HEPN-associated N-terminal domain-containing protein n=1 Tax=Candidatus Palauibacter sp. TaxID=3101350 RepID=UPI003B5C5B29
MGRTKEAWLADSDRTYFQERGEQFVCADCVADPFLRETLEIAAVDQACSFCGLSPSADLLVLLEEVEDFLTTEYEDPVHSLMYVTKEGGYQGTVNTGYELVLDLLAPWFNSDDALGAVATAFGDSYWCERDYFRLKHDERLKFGWERFSEQVKHRTRYRFFDLTFEESDSDDGVSPGKMLGELGTLFDDFNLFRMIREGSTVFRARVHDVGLRPSTAEQLRPPPRANAMQSNRMSPAGISMFYGAFDEETAVKETFDPTLCKCKMEVVTVAEFRARRDLLTVDLTDLPDSPSPFDRDKRHLRRPLWFLREFVQELSQPIRRDGREHVEYVPTQVVTEFLRFRHRGADERPIEGLVYNSARKGGKAAVVLFLGPEECGPRRREEEVWLAEEILSLRKFTRQCPRCDRLLSSGSLEDKLEVE